VDPGNLDVQVFQDRLRRGRAAHRGGDWALASGELGAALTLWRGEPLPDLRAAGLLAEATARWSEQRLQALEWRIDSDVHLGRHHDVIAELSELAAAHPMRESFAGLLMMACYQSGRQADALQASVVARFGVHVSTQQKVYLGKIDGPTIDIQVGEIPVPSRVEFTAFAILNTDGSVGIEYYADYAHTLAAQCQIDMTGGGGSGCSPVDQDNSQDGGLEAGVKVYASMQVAGGIQFGVSLQIAFLAGPEVTFTPKLSFTANTTANPRRLTYSCPSGKSAAIWWAT
jgi:hypothetical protein